MNLMDHIFFSYFLKKNCQFKIQSLGDRTYLIVVFPCVLVFHDSF